MSPVAARARLDGGAVAETFRMLEDPGPRLLRHLRRVVGRTVVDDDDLGIGVTLDGAGNNGADCRGFILRGYYDGK